MKCPYCAEKIQDKASVCRYCGRDLSLVLSLKRENERLREKLLASEGGDRELTVLGDSDRSGDEHSRTLRRATPRGRKRPTVGQSALAVSVPAVAVAAAHIIDHQIYWSTASDEAKEAMTTDIFGLTEWHFVWADFLFLSCFVSGCWLGAWWIGRHIKTYFFFGTLVSLVVALELLTYETIRTEGLGSSLGEIGRSFSGVLVVHSIADSDYIPVYAFGPLDIHVYAIIITTLFVSGALFGDLIERVRHPNRAEPGLPERIVARLPDSLSGKHLATTLRALPATLLLLTPVWQPVWTKAIEVVYSAFEPLPPWK